MLYFRSGRSQHSTEEGYSNYLVLFGSWETPPPLDTSHPNRSINQHTFSKTFLHIIHCIYNMYILRALRSPVSRIHQGQEQQHQQTAAFAVCVCGGSYIRALGREGMHSSSLHVRKSRWEPQQRCQHQIDVFRQRPTYPARRDNQKKVTAVCTFIQQYSKSTT